MPEDVFYHHFQTVEIFGWIRNIEVKPYHDNEINTSEKKNRTCEIGFLRNLNVFCSNHDLRSWGWELIQCHFSVNSFSLWKEKFAICKCKKRRLLFAALPDIDLAKIILFFFVCFFVGVKEEITDSYPVAIYMCFWSERLGKSLRAKRICQQQGSFLHEHAHQDLIKSTRPVTATVVHSHRDQILHFENLLEIQMAAGT